MTEQERLKKLLDLATNKSDFIDQQLSKMEKMLDKGGAALNRSIIKEYLSALSVENGVVLNNSQNIRKSEIIYRLYEVFIEDQGVKIITTMSSDMMKIGDLNKRYFKELKATRATDDQVKKLILTRLGLDDNGNLRDKGFLKGVLEDPHVRNEIVDYVVDKTSTGTGYEDLKNGLKDLIEGDNETMGNLKKYYRNIAYDTYTKIDALNSKLYADKLKMDYFIYAGTRRKASRQFCIERKGKIFSRAEAEKWKDLIGKKDGPIVKGAEAEAYNPLVDRGGYGCVDDINWISEEIAFIRRPDLKQKK